MLELYRERVTELGPAVRQRGIYLWWPVWYVGRTRQSGGFLSRWEGHLRDLQSGRHPNDAMRAYWQRYADLTPHILMIVEPYPGEAFDAFEARLARWERHFIRRYGHANEAR